MNRDNFNQDINRDVIQELQKKDSKTRGENNKQKLTKWQKIKAFFANERTKLAIGVILILVGIFLFVTQIRLPEILSSCLSSVAGLNTPLAMFTVGVYLAQTDLKKMLGRRSLYLISALRLLVIPGLSLLLLMLFPVSMEQMRTVLLIVAACPVGSNVAVYAQLHNKDYPYAVETVVISTLLSIVTIPFILYLSSLIW